MIAHPAGLSCGAIVDRGGARIGVTHHTAQRCLRRALGLGVILALDDSPPPDRKPDITSEAKAWLVFLACRKAKDLGYLHELWTSAC